MIPTFHMILLSSIRCLSACALILQLAAKPINAPQLTIRDFQDRPVPLNIENFDTTILLFEDLAQTTLTITFKSTVKRSSEGELAIPLPPGATVSGYALDVNGQMRESTVVRKELARFAYESIKARNIDPGYIEREEGNVYRTKIFPIPGEGTKTVRLSYCEILEPNQQKVSYRLPLPSAKIEKSTFTVEHPGLTPLTFPESAPLAFKINKKGIHQATLQNTPLPTQLKITYSLSKNKLPLKAGELIYSRSTPAKEQGNIIPPNANAFELIWDCSESRRSQDLKPDFEFLSQLFKDRPNLKVKLTRLAFNTSDGGVFSVQGGNWQKLRMALETSFYDGATNLAIYQPEKLPALIFTDGHSHYAPLTAPWQKPVSIFDSSNTCRSYWKKQAELSGGTYQGNQSRPPSPFERTFLKAERSPPPNRVETHQGVIKLVSTLAAQRQLAKLEAAFYPDPAKILAHCTKHHLVSDYTSLIVLDRFQDYLLYQIPPPEPELRRTYEAAMAKRTKQQDIPKRLRADQRKWHETDSHWREKTLLPAIMRISVWKKALLKTFAPDELNADHLAKILKWQKDAAFAYHEVGERRNPDDEQKWRRKLEELNQRATGLEQLTIGRPSPQKKITVAVNGLISKPGKVTGPPSLTLLSALKQAGGANPYGSMARISIYRNAHKTTYNTLSKEFSDIPLKAGDLIVVEENPLIFEEENPDPFAGPDGEPLEIDHQEEPVNVTLFSDPPFSDYIDFYGDDGDADPFGGLSLQKKKTEIPSATFKLPKATWDTSFETFLTSLKGGDEDLALTYKKLRTANRYPDSFYLQLGDFLLARKKKGLADQVLSNLIEGPEARPSAYRQWAGVLAKHGHDREAADLLARIGRRYPSDQAIMLDQAWVAGRLNESKARNRFLQKAVEKYDSTLPDTENLATIALREMDRMEEDQSPPVDLRIVVTSLSGQTLKLTLTEPIGTLAHFELFSEDSPLGGRSFESVGVGEYLLRDAALGDYHLNYRSESTQLARVQIYRNWARKNEKLEEKIIFLPSRKARNTFLTYKFQAE